MFVVVKILSDSISLDSVKFSRALFTQVGSCSALFTGVVNSYEPYRYWLTAEKATNVPRNKNV